MGQVQKITTKGAFVHGRYVPKGFPVAYDEKDLNGRETHLIDMGDFQPDVVQMAAVAPTGPNPKEPQQVPPDARQTVEGHVIPGAILRGETTSTSQQADAEALLDDSGSGQEAVADALAKAAGKDVDPLDHDENGKKGGSRKGAEATASKADKE